MPLPKNPKRGRGSKIGSRIGESVGSEEELLELLGVPDEEAIKRFQKLFTSLEVSTWGGEGLEFRKDLPHGVRSGWEANFARWLHYHEIPYDYELCRFPVPGVGHYLPDFRMAISGVFVEVKGLWMPKAKRKVKAFIEEYPEERVLVLDREYYRMLTPVKGWER